MARLCKSVFYFLHANITITIQMIHLLKVKIKQNTELYL